MIDKKIVDQMAKRFFEESKILSFLISPKKRKNTKPRAEQRNKLLTITEDK